VSINGNHKLCTVLCFAFSLTDTDTCADFPATLLSLDSYDHLSGGGSEEKRSAGTVSGRMRLSESMSLSEEEVWLISSFLNVCACARVCTYT